MKVLYSKKNGISNKLSGVNLPVDADKINYDNTESELQSTNVQDAIDEVVADKVDKVAGKGLSTNDYNNTDKAKVDKIDDTTTSATGNPISISGLKSNQLAINPIITLEPIQAGSGDPSPSNVRAISGYDNIEVVSARKNICPYLITDFEYTANLEGNATKNGDILTVTTYSSAFNAGAYAVFSFISEYAGKTCSYSFYAKANKNANVLVGLETMGQKEVELTTEWQQIKIENILFDNSQKAFTIYSHSGECEIQIKNLMFELGSTCSEYEPYNPLTNIQLTLGQTIYGGTLDLEKGVLTVDRGYREYDGTDSWGHSSGWNSSCYSIRLSDGKHILGYDTVANIISNLGVAQTPASLADSSSPSYGIGRGGYDMLYANIKSDLNTYEKWTQYLQSNHLQIYYELESPYTIQLTPHEISLLKDYAYASTNGTNISLSYHNGEMASLGDVSALGETVNKLADNINDTIDIKTDTKMDNKANTFLGAKNLLKKFSLESSAESNTRIQCAGIPVMGSCDYIFSCSCAKALNVRLYQADSTGTQISDSNWLTGDYTNFKFTVLSNAYTVTVRLKYTDDSIIAIEDVINPMFRIATDSDPTYAPYSMTNRELTNTVDIIPTSLGGCNKWVAGGPYVIGDYCEYKNVIYRCTTGNSSGNPPDQRIGQYWEVVSLSSLRNKFEKTVIGVDADGVKTWQQLLNELFAQISYEGVTYDSKLYVYIASTGKWSYNLVQWYRDHYALSYCVIGSSTGTLIANINEIYLHSSGSSKFDFERGTGIDNSLTVPTSNTHIYFVY